MVLPKNGTWYRRVNRSLCGLKTITSRLIFQFFYDYSKGWIEQFMMAYSLLKLVYGDLLSIIDSMLMIGFHIKYFFMNNLESRIYFVGIEVARSKEGITISQRKYTLDILDDMSLLRVTGCFAHRKNLSLLCQ